MGLMWGYEHERERVGGVVGEGRKIEEREKKENNNNNNNNKNNDNSNNI